MRLLVFIATITLCLVVSSAVLPWFEQAPKPDGSLSFLVIGDWGRRGAYNQSEVAVQMGVIGERLDIDFVISTGDNFYDNGLRGIDDASFDHSFTKIYTAPSLQKQWYSEVAEFFFVDTTPFVDKYFTEPEDHVYDWRGMWPRRQYISNLLKEMDLALKLSNAKWKIVVGHHTIRSVGHHGDTKELVNQLLPILEANNIDLFINGHDHCLQHISSLDSEIQFLTSGGGSKAWRGDMSWRKPEEMKFYYDGQGFMSVRVTETELDIAFYDVCGTVLHKWNSSKQLHSTL